MHPLDNPIWKALTTSLAHLAESADLARRFPAEVSVLGAVSQTNDKAYGSLAAITGASPVGLFLEELPQLPANWTVISSVPLLQMVHEDPMTPSAASSKLEDADPSLALPQLIELTAAESPEMMALAELTKPGPFGRRTHELGTYLGIRRQGKLAAMAGERLRVPGFTEISAVCTHPDFLGHGYATALMKELMQRIRRRGERPFLHVRADNTRPIELYQRLGFTERTVYQYTVVRRTE
jgi:ribosomal protein S18 acetylase RimI-like enzyme